MLKKSIVAVVILFAGLFVYLQIHSWFGINGDDKNIHHGSEIQNQSANAPSHKSDFLGGNDKNLAVVGKRDETSQYPGSSGETLAPERNQLSKYYLEGEEHQRLKEDGLFEGEAKDKLFEIRRKMIDSKFDAKKMSENLTKKLNEAPNGKLPYEEFLSLMPKETVADFEEMMRQVNKGTE